MSGQDRIQTLLGFLQMDPDDPFTRFALAREYQKVERSADALDCYEALISQHASYVGTYYHYGKLLEELGRKDEAISIYEAGIRVADAANDFHARAELQDALMQAKGIGFEDE